MTRWTARSRSATKEAGSRGIGAFTDGSAADRVNSDPEFASFNDAVAPLLAEPPDRVEHELLHLFTETG
jgi:hypothetical protein